MMSLLSFKKNLGFLGTSPLIFCPSTSCIMMAYVQCGHLLEWDRFLPLIGDAHL